jgi:predicted RNA binding protein YcfA (HicA-like mRNA interferase family)
VLKALGRKGFVVVRQSGSHISVQSADGKYRTVVPRHSEIKRSTLMKLIAEAGLTEEEFIELLG